MAANKFCALFPLPLTFSLLFSLSGSSRGLVTTRLGPWTTKIARLGSSGVILCEPRDPPPHLGSWIDRLCNPFQDVADCLSVPYGSRSWSSPHEPGCHSGSSVHLVRDRTLDQPPHAEGVTMNVSSKNARSRSPWVSFLLAAGRPAHRHHLQRCGALHHYPSPRRVCHKTCA